MGYAGSILDHISENVVPEPNCGCLIYIGPWQSRDYGIFRKKLVHREAWEAVNGPIPEGMTIDHLCKVKACVNLDHMEVVTRGENTIRAHLGLQYEKCRRGHDLTEENIYLSVRKATGRVQRCCKACHRMNILKAAHNARKC